MPNKNYEAGRAFEYQVRDVFVACGFDPYECGRSAGSHGRYDVLGHGPSFARLAQCKKVKHHNYAILSELMALVKSAPRKPYSTREIWIKTTAGIYVWIFANDDILAEVIARTGELFGFKGACSALSYDESYAAFVLRPGAMSVATHVRQRIVEELKLREPQSDGGTNANPRPKVRRKSS